MIKDWQKLNILNHSNLKLAALLKLAGSKALDTAETNLLRRNSNPLVIVCHGFTGSKEGGGRAIEMGDSLAGKGYSTLLFDFAGCGESDGSWADLTLSSQIADLSAVVKWSRLKGFNRLILTGRSFGGSTVICYSAIDREIEAVCTWAAVARPDQLFSRLINASIKGDPEELITVNGEEGTVQVKRNFFLDLTKHKPINCAAQLAPSHFLIIHGTKDQSVPSSDASDLFQAAGEPKELALIKGADHRFTNHLNQVWTLFFSWLDRLI